MNHLYYRIPIEKYGQLDPGSESLCGRFLFTRSIARPIGQFVIVKAIVFRIFGKTRDIGFRPGHWIPTRNKFLSEFMLKFWRYQVSKKLGESLLADGLNCHQQCLCCKRLNPNSTVTSTFYGGLIMHECDYCHNTWNHDNYAEILIGWRKATGQTVVS